MISEYNKIKTKELEEFAKVEKGGSTRETFIYRLL
jgi:hypothetical protein